MDKKFAYFVDFRSQHNILTEALTKDEVAKVATKAGKLSVKVKVPFSTLVSSSIDSLNNHVSALITGDDLALLDIDYHVAGRTTNNEVILKVTADVTEFLK